MAGGGWRGREKAETPPLTSSTDSHLDGEGRIAVWTAIRYFTRSDGLEKVLCIFAETLYNPALG